MVPCLLVHTVLYLWCLPVLSYFCGNNCCTVPCAGGGGRAAASACLHHGQSTTRQCDPRWSALHWTGMPRCSSGQAEPGEQRWFLWPTLQNRHTQRERQTVFITELLSQCFGFCFACFLMYLTGFGWPQWERFTSISYDYIIWMFLFLLLHLFAMNNSVVHQILFLLFHAVLLLLGRFSFHLSLNREFK